MPPDDKQVTLDQGSWLLGGYDGDYDFVISNALQQSYIH